MARNWHRQKIIYAVRRRGSNLRRLAIEHGYCPTTLYKALNKPWPRAHAAIASFIGVRRSRMWPEFYDDAGERRWGRQNSINRRSP